MSKTDFKTEFENLVSQTSKETQELWAKEGSLLIIGNLLTITPTGFQGKFHGKLADEFHKLMLKNNLVV